MKLLYERQDPEQLETLVESDENLKTKKYKIKGIFSTIGEKNRNGRIYPRNLWESEVQKYQEILKSGSKNRLCEWQHPDRSDVDPMQAVAAIDKLWIDGKYVMGEATLLNNEKANQLKSLIDCGIKISVSSRGVGNVRNGLVENFKLITYDLVDCPSDFNATMDGYITESVKDYDIIDDKIVEIEKSQEVEKPKISFNEIFKFVKELK